jgi:hypothetical protein
VDEDKNRPQTSLKCQVGGDALFTAGGTGAGKTTAIRTNSQTRGLISEAAVVYDSNFNSLGSARAKVTRLRQNALIRRICYTSSRACFDGLRFGG